MGGRVLLTASCLLSTFVSLVLIFVLTGGVEQQPVLLLWILRRIPCRCLVACLLPLFCFCSFHFFAFIYSVTRGVCGGSRWHKDTDPAAHLGAPWTPAEETILCYKYRLIGPQWGEIIKIFPHR